MHHMIFDLYCYSIYVKDMRFKVEETHDDDDDDEFSEPTIKQ